jgi:hypothetical protein
MLLISNTEDASYVIADGFDEALIGIGSQFGKPIAVYDKKKCLEILEREMPPEDAEEYFSFNVEGSWVGEQTPIFL